MPAETRKNLLERLGGLQARLDDAEETLRALRSGEVDAFVASGPDGDQVYTLKGADEPYRVIVEGMAEGALTLTSGGLILFSNQQFATLVQCPLERVIGSMIQDFVSPEELGVVSALLAGCHRRKAELQLKTVGSQTIPVYLSVENLVLSGAECLCLIVTDLSEQKRQEEIVAAEKLARSILEQSAEAILVVDPTGRIIRASRAAERLAGAAVELRQFDHAFPISLDSGEPYPFAKIWAAAKHSRTINAVEAVAVTPTAERVELLLSAAVLTGAESGSLACVVNLTDITERRSRERQLKIQSDILKESEARERTRSAELSRANDDLRQFAFAASHDLQEPLRMIASYSQLLVKAARDGNHEEAGLSVGYITEGTQRMRQLLADLLAYTQVTGDGQEPLTPVNLDAILAQAIENLRTAIERNQASVTADPLPVVYGRDVHFVQLFQNLIENAIKYRGPEPPSIHISATHADGAWCMSVADNGMGIDQEYHQQIFGVFKRLHGKSIPGTGIGLAICQRVVERYDGKIWVDSQPNRGSTFYFTVPCKGT